MLLLSYYYAGRFDDEAMSTMKWAVERDSNNARIHINYALILMSVRRYNESIESAKMAFRLNPKPNIFYYNILGWAYLYAGRYEEAIAPLKEAISRVPSYPDSNIGLAAIYTFLGRKEEARHVVEKFLSAKPDFSLENWIKTNIRHQDPAYKERIANACRKAGLK